MHERMHYQRGLIDMGTLQVCDNNGSNFSYWRGWSTLVQ